VLTLKEANRHFQEIEHRKEFLSRIRQQIRDGSERSRILEELYEWFMLTQTFVVNT